MMHYKLLCELVTGKSFGGLAFENKKRQRRSAAIYAKTNCYLLTLDGYDYTRMLKKIIMQIHNKTWKFIESIPFIADSWCHNEVLSLNY